MKTWTMPKVNIEAFTPNEYVATCQFLIVLSAGQKVFLDVNTGGSNTGTYQLGEDATVATNGSNIVTVSSELSQGIHGNVAVYASKATGTNGRYNSLLGVYDVYVYDSNRHAFLYEAGHTPSTTPTTNNNFAS